MSPWFIAIQHHLVLFGLFYFILLSSKWLMVTLFHFNLPILFINDFILIPPLYSLILLYFGYPIRCYLFISYRSPSVVLHFISFSFWYFIHFFVFKGMTYSSAGSLGIQGVEAIVELKLIFLFLSGFVLMSAFCFSRGAALRFQGESPVFFFFFFGWFT